MVKRILEHYWVPIENKVVGLVASSFIKAVSWSMKNPHGLKKIRRPVYIYKNLEGTTGKTYHDGRYAENKKYFSVKFQKVMEKNRYNLIFLIVAENNKQYVIKPFQYSPEKDEERKISKKMAELGIGPEVVNHVFKCKFGKSYGSLFVESCVSRGEGWRPVYLVEKYIKNHKWFLAPFVDILKKLHKEKIFYFEDFYTHLFVNPMNHKLKLIDFGMSFYTTVQGRFDDETELALSSLKRLMFRPALQALFLKMYQKDFRKLGISLRTDTIIIDGVEYPYKHG